MKVQILVGIENLTQSMYMNPLGSFFLVKTSYSLYLLLMLDLNDKLPQKEEMSS